MPNAVSTAAAASIGTVAPAMQLMDPAQRAQALAYTAPFSQQLPPAFSHHLAACAPAPPGHAISHVPPGEYAASHQHMLQEGWAPPHARFVLPQTNPFFPGFQQLQLTMGNGIVQTFSAQSFTSQPQPARQHRQTARLTASFLAPQVQEASTAPATNASTAHAHLPAVSLPAVSVHAAPGLPDHRSIPKLSSIDTVARLWQLYDVGDAISGKKAWRVLEEEEQSSWRHGQRQRWNEVYTVASSILERAGERVHTDGEHQPPLLRYNAHEIGAIVTATSCTQCI